MRLGDVPLGERGKRVVSCREQLLQLRAAVGQRPLDRLLDQLLARVEVLVEAAVGEPGGAHDLRHPGLIGAALPDPCRGRIDDPLVARRLLVFRMSHEIDDSDHPYVIG